MCQGSKKKAYPASWISHSTLGLARVPPTATQLMFEMIQLHHRNTVWFSHLGPPELRSWHARGWDGKLCSLNRSTKLGGCVWCMTWWQRGMSRVYKVASPKGLNTKLCKATTLLMQRSPFSRTVGVHRLVTASPLPSTFLSPHNPNHHATPVQQ